MGDALAGVKILDFSTLLPGPYATMALADLGAQVLRIESPTRVDPARQLAPVEDGISAAHAYLNRNKRALALDLKQADAVAIVQRLVASYDIVIEQFRPGVMARLGLGYEALREHNPALIYCSITGYGQDGPYRDRAGHDINYLSIAGIAGYTGREGPVPLGVQLADSGGSLYAAIAILAALTHRIRTGEGQHLDLSMTDAAFSLHAAAGAAFLAGGRAPHYGTERLNGGTYYDYYETADGRHFSVGSLEPQFMTAFCEAMGHPEWAAMAGRAKPGEQSELKRQIADAFRARTFEQWRRIFARSDCCVEPVLSLEEAAGHPQLAARGMLVDVPAASGKVYRQAAHPVRYSATPPRYRHTGEALGHGGRSVLLELGYDEQAIDALEMRGVTMRPG
jgi:crotonobetainyl-CoA:carnitine CoA-transferase CaiB-like acyl-CoA transferase